MIEIRTLNSLAKVFPDLPLKEEYAADHGSALLGERFSFQAAYRCVDRPQTGVSFRAESDLGEALSVRFVDNVPCDLTVPSGCEDVCEHPLPGLMPDILRPIPPVLWAYNTVWRALWLTVDTGKAAPGEHVIRVVISDGQESTCEFRLDILNFRLPEQELPVTNWF
ncbi:MAG: hypothetical protein II184_05325, partial [Clostridia bacterium]|nr:hypothetical protein [Clostridia bacterium]